jgi:glycosyltransferase involved in cell wall biosynthesis
VLKKHPEPDLSIVVLCYRAEDTIRTFVSQLETEMAAEGIVHYELILVANYDAGSKDNTPFIVKEIAASNPDITVIAREKKGKMGWDMRSGLDAASGRYIAVIDGDGQMPVSDIPIVYKIIQTGHYDLVKTFRAKRFDGFTRKWMSRLYNLLFSLLFKVSFPVIDINSKPKILTRSAYQRMQLKSDDWFTDSEIMLQANDLKLRVCQISTVFYEHERRKSFVNPGTAFEFIYNLLFYRLAMLFKKN